MIDIVRTAGFVTAYQISLDGRQANYDTGGETGSLFQNTSVTCSETVRPRKWVCVGGTLVRFSGWESDDTCVLLNLSQYYFIVTIFVINVYMVLFLFNPLNPELNPICYYFIVTIFVINVYMVLFLFNPLNPELNPICYLLALLGAHHFLHVSMIRVKLLTFRLLMSYIYGAPILDVSRSHTTTQHSR